VKVFGVVGWKNSGKTTLVEGLVAEFSGRGLTVSTVKHAHHVFDVDPPGTDSARHRAAGAREVLVASSRRWALMHELDGEAEPGLDAHLARLGPCDLVLVEGYKAGSHPKIEVRSGQEREAPVAMLHPNVRAFAGVPPEGGPDLPVFDRSDLPAIAAFISAELGL
jgi:molybdopterin-guanine dinucleotide biosynthesis protein MobB